MLSRRYSPVAAALEAQHAARRARPCAGAPYPFDFPRSQIPDADSSYAVIAGWRGFSGDTTTGADGLSASRSARTS